MSRKIILVDLRSAEAEAEIDKISDWASVRLLEEAVRRGWRPDRVLAGFLMGAAVGFRRIVVESEGKRTFLALAERMWDVVMTAPEKKPN